MSKIRLAYHRAALSGWKSISKSAILMWNKFGVNASNEVGLLEQEGREHQAICDKQREIDYALSMIEKWKAFEPHLKKYSELLEEENIPSMDDLNTYLHSIKP